MQFCFELFDHPAQYCLKMNQVKVIDLCVV